MDSNKENVLDGHSISANSSHSLKNSKLYFKPFRIKDITQEILDAENEPLQDLNFNEDECEEEPKAYTEIVLNNKFEELGVTVLETPRKPNESSISGAQTKNDKLFSSTPHCPLKRNEFVTPGFMRTVEKVSDNNTLKVPTLSTQTETRTKPVNESTEEELMSQLKVYRLNNEQLNIIQFRTIVRPQISINNVNYEIIKELGKGGSSIVYHCFNVRTKEERAIKRVNLESDTQRIGYFNEVNVLNQMKNCDRVIHMYDYKYIESTNTLLLVLEKGEADLSMILKNAKKSKKHLPLYIIILYWMEMLYAVQQIHSNNIIHADLKPANFLLVNGRIKLIDFGIATCVQDDMTSAIRSSQVGTFQYISPEALVNQPNNNYSSPNYGKPQYKLKYESDVWSLGCILYQLVYQKTPFQHVAHMWAKLAMIVDPNHQIDYPSLEWVPEKLVSTIKSCLQYNAKSRPSIIDLIKDYENYYDNERTCT